MLERGLEETSYPESGDQDIGVLSYRPVEFGETLRCPVTAIFVIPILVCDDDSNLRRTVASRERRVKHGQRLCADEEGPTRNPNLTEQACIDAAPAYLRIHGANKVATVDGEKVPGQFAANQARARRVPPNKVWVQLAPVLMINVVHDVGATNK